MPWPLPPRCWNIAPAPLYPGLVPAAWIVLKHRVSRDVRSLCWTAVTTETTSPSSTPALLRRRLLVISVLQRVITRRFHSAKFYTKFSVKWKQTAFCLFLLRFRAYYQGLRAIRPPRGNIETAAYFVLVITTHPSLSKTKALYNGRTNFLKLVFKQE